MSAVIKPLRAYSPFVYVFSKTDQATMGSILKRYYFEECAVSRQPWETNAKIVEQSWTSIQTLALSHTMLKFLHSKEGRSKTSSFSLKVQPHSEGDDYN